MREGVPDFLGSSDVQTQSYDPAEKGRALLDALRLSDIGQYDQSRTATDIMFFVFPGYGVKAADGPVARALQELAVACGWSPPE